MTLERNVSENQAADDGVERAAQERVAAEQTRIVEERDSRWRMLSATVNEAVARIRADAEHDIALRRAQREPRLREHARPRKKTL
jgi:hypothetical protein